MLNLMHVDEASLDIGYHLMPLAQITDNPYQTRITLDAEHIKGIADSLMDLRPELPDRRGLQQIPLARLIWYGNDEIVQRSEYRDAEHLRQLIDERAVVAQLCFGHSRFHAFQVLAKGPKALFPDQDWTTDFWPHGIQDDFGLMPLTVVHVDDLGMWKHAVTENHRRRGLTAIEEAMAIRTAKKTFGLNSEAAGAIFGWTRSTTVNKERLLKLPEEIQKQILEGAMSERNARSLLALADHPDTLLQVAKEKKDAPVAELEWEIKRHLNIAKDLEEQHRQEQFMRDAGYQVACAGDGMQAHQFTAHDITNTKLIKNGLCSRESCVCFATCHTRNIYGNAIQLDEKNAPNMVAACTDKAAARVKFDKLSKESHQKDKDEQDLKKAKVMQANAEIEAQWQSATLDLQMHCKTRNPWADPDFWRLIAKRLLSYSAQNVAEGNWGTMDGLVDALLLALLKSTRKYDSSNIETYDQGKVTKLIEEINGLKKGAK